MLLSSRGRPPECPRRRIAWQVPTVLALALPFTVYAQPPLGDGPESDEIVVTARKVPENLARLPMSVQPLAGDALDRRRSSDLYDVQFAVPGLVVTSAGMFGAGIALRGVTDDAGGSLAIAPYVDGVYLGRASLALARLFDIERIEVVKGPQGTLYGRNATGGAINVLTRAPDDTFGAAVEGSYASFDTARIQGHLNVAGERIAGRVAFVGSAGDGFIRNTVDDRRFAQQDYAGIRASLRARPTAALTIGVTAQRVEDDGGSGDLWLPRKDYLPDPNDIRLTTVTLPDPFLDTTNDLGRVDVSYEFGGVTLRSITGYARNLTNDVDDCAGLPSLRGCVRSVRPLRYEARSQELRFESTLQESLRWLIGAFYLNADEDTRFHFSAPLLAPGPINDYSAASDEGSYAVFGDATRTVGERWSVNGGLRVSRDEQRVSDVGSGIADNRTPTAAAGSWHDTSWRLGFSVSPSDRLLVYGSVSTGFKAGGITTEVLPNGEFDSFDPEHLLAYEAGISATLPGRRSTVRASVFFYDYEDMQVRTTAVLANRVTSVVDNAAAARIYGLDASSSARLSERVTFSGALVWMPTRKFVQFDDALTGGSLAGNTLSRAPEWSATLSVGYVLPIPRIGELSTNVDYSYRSQQFFTRDEDPLLAQEAFGLLGVAVRLSSTTGRWYVFASARNALGADYFTQVLVQSSPGYPATYEAGFGVRF